jgi:hypothetical protein
MIKKMQARKVPLRWDFFMPILQKSTSRFHG